MFGLLTYLAALLAVIIGSVLRPPIALAGVLCLFGLKQWGQSSSALIGQYPLLTNYALGVITFVAVLRAAFKRGCLFCRFPPAFVLTVCLLLYAILTLTWSLDLDSGLAAWASSSPYLVIIILLAPLLINDLDDLKTAFTWTMVVGGSLCFLAVLFGNWGYRGLEVAFAVPVGSLLEKASVVYETNPLALASLGGTVVVIASVLLLEKGRPWLKILALVSIPFALAMIIRSGSRGQLLAALPAFLLAGAIAFRARGLRTWLPLALLALFITGLGWWATSLINVDKSRWLGSDLAAGDVEGRFEMAGAVLDAAMAHPLAMFIGLGNSSSFKLLGIYPHITILEVLAEEGLPGIALYLAILICAIRSIRRSARAVAEDPARRVTLGILAGLFLFELVLSWKQGSLLGSSYVFCYAIILGRVELALANARALQPAPAVAGPTTLPAFPNLLS